MDTVGDLRGNRGSGTSARVPGLKVPDADDASTAPRGPLFDPVAGAEPDPSGSMQLSTTNSSAGCSATCSSGWTGPAAGPPRRGGLDVSTPRPRDAGRPPLHGPAARCPDRRRRHRPGGRHDAVRLGVRSPLTIPHWTSRRLGGWGRERPAGALPSRRPRCACATSPGWRSAFRRRTSSGVSNAGLGRPPRRRTGPQRPVPGDPPATVRDLDEVFALTIR